MDLADLTLHEQAELLRSAGSARDFEPKDTRDEGAKALADLKSKAMQIDDLSPAETARMREKLGSINSSIAANIGQPLWDETQAALAKLRAK